METLSHQETSSGPVALEIASLDGVTSKLQAETRDLSDFAYREGETREDGGPSADRSLSKPHLSFFVEAVTSRTAAKHHIAWADLCTRALEANVFLEPSFAVPLMQHVEPHDRPDVLLVWQVGPVAFERLVGLMPVTLPRHALPGIARAYSDKQIALGTPLLDKHLAYDVFAAMVSWLHDKNPRAAALIVTTIPSGGAFERIATAVCRNHDCDVRRLAERKRAIFRPDANFDPLPAKRLKEWRRQDRRLSEMGSRAHSTATTPSDVARALERFLALEHNGWKGRRGTSLLADGRRATFARTMTRLMAHEGRCRIEAIELNGRPVAMGILLTTGTRAHFWKTAFDESLGRHSPGVQLVRHLTETLRLDPQIAETDSCALPDHAMIDRLWPQRLALVDLMIGVAPSSCRPFDTALRVEVMRRQVREALKALVLRIRRRTAP